MPDLKWSVMFSMIIFKSTDRAKAWIWDMIRVYALVGGINHILYLMLHIVFPQTLETRVLSPYADITVGTVQIYLFELNL